MRKKRESSLMKKIMAGCLVAVILVSGIVVLPKTVKAEETGNIEKENGIIYSPLSMSTYWNAEGTKTAPVMEDCVFAGKWYSNR